DNTANELGSLGSGNSVPSFAYAINNAGKIVGESMTSSSGPYHAFRTASFNSINPNTDDLGTFSGGTTSQAWAINDLDEVVGQATKSDGYWHAFLTKPGKKIDETGTADDAEDLGFLGTGTLSEAYGINNRGMVVGRSSTSGMSNLRAFLYFRGHAGMINLNDKIDSSL